MAEKFGTARQGPLLWKLKNHIDRKFMNQFVGLKPTQLPDVPLTAAEGVREALGDKPLCGGCGSKVGRNVLKSALPEITREDILSVTGDDAAILKTGGAMQVLSLIHI